MDSNRDRENRDNTNRDNTNRDNTNRDNINQFRLPIEYLSKIKLLDKNIITDLELSKSSEHESLYQNVFATTTTFGKNTLEHWSKYYT